MMLCLISTKAFTGTNQTNHRLGGGGEVGNKVYQRILECGWCGRTPEDGEPMWEMSGEYVCETCLDDEDGDDEPDIKCFYCGEESCDCDML